MLTLTNESPVGLKDILLEVDRRVQASNKRFAEMLVVKMTGMEIRRIQHQSATITFDIESPSPNFEEALAKYVYAKRLLRNYETEISRIHKYHRIYDGSLIWERRDWMVEQVKLLSKKVIPELKRRKDELKGI